MNVTDAILDRLPATLELMSCSFLLSLVVGIAAGVFAAIKPYTWGDYVMTTFAFFRAIHADLLVCSDAAACICGAWP